MNTFGVSALAQGQQIHLLDQAAQRFGLSPLATGDALYAEPNVVAIEKGDAQWNAKVTEVVSQLKADGTLGKISQKWIGADISQ